MWCAIVIDYNYGDGDEITHVFTSQSRQDVVNQVFQHIKPRYASSDPEYQPSQYFTKYGEVMNGADSYFFRHGKIEIHQSANLM